ncbi:MAG: YIP1 family protein [Anaerolineae bacterium]
MNQLVQTTRSALLLEDNAFVSLRDAEDGFRRGLMTIVIISLIVGLIVSLVSFVSAVTTTPAQEMAEFQQGMEQVVGQMRAFGAFGGDEEFWRIFMENFEAGIAIGERVADVVAETTPAPKPVVDFFTALGRWVSHPFEWLSMWMLYGVLTLVFAKLLGGTATIREMLATTSLVAVPHLLNALRFIPFLGFLAGAVAFFWGLAIYVKGTAIANRFDLGRALLAVAAPIIVLFVMIMILVFLMIILIAVST